MPTINKKFDDLAIRIISGVIFFSLAIGALFSGVVIASGFLGICIFVLVWEVFFIFSSGKTKFSGLNIIIPGVLFFVPILNLYGFYPIIILVSVASLTAFLKKSFLKFLCILYIGGSIVLFQSVFVLGEGYYNLYYLLFIISVVAASDIGGYFVGRLIGGPKIYKLISPNKTWAGCLGGVLFAVTVAVFFRQIFNYSFSAMIFLSFILAISSQFGDFFESWLKRRYNVKDSGHLLPGHGGFFDRLDGLLAAVPVYTGITYFWN